MKSHHMENFYALSILFKILTPLTLMTHSDDAYLGPEVMKKVADAIVISVALRLTSEEL